MMLMNGIRSEYKLHIWNDGVPITMIAKRKASKSPFILPIGSIILFGKYHVKVYEVAVTISYDVVYYECVIKDKLSITDDELQELTNYGFKQVEKDDV